MRHEMKKLNYTYLIPHPSALFPPCKPKISIAGTPAHMTLAREFFFSRIGISVTECNPAASIPDFNNNLSKIDSSSPPT